MTGFIQENMNLLFCLLFFSSRLPQCFALLLVAACIPMLELAYSIAKKKHTKGSGKGELTG